MAESFEPQSRDPADQMRVSNRGAIVGRPETPAVLRRSEPCGTSTGHGHHRVRAQRERRAPS